MSVTSNKIISDTSISITDIKSALGVSSNDVGTLCKASAVNKWSFYKPVVYNGVATGNMTDHTSVLYGVNDGFTISTYVKPSEIFKAVVAGTSWVYNKPTGGSSSPYRMGDFRSYSHLAKPWFMPTLSSSSAKIGDSIRYYHVADNNDMSLPVGNVSIGWLIENFNVFAPYRSASTTNKNGYYLCILYATSTNPNSCFVQKLISVPNLIDNESEYVDKGIPIKVPTGLSADTTYYLIPCVATIPTTIVANPPTTEAIGSTAVQVNESSGTNFGTYYPIPTEVVTIKTIAASSPVGTIMQYLTFELSSGTARMTGSVFSNLNFTVNLKVGSGYNGTSGTASVEYYVDGIIENGTIVNKRLGENSFGSITKNSNVSRSLSYSSSLEKASSKEESLPIRCELTVQVGTTTYKRTETIYITDVTIV